jgi:hypothetical protein
MNLSYTRMRAREADAYLNEFDAAPNWRENYDTRPHRFSGTAVWALPFGKGRALARSGWLNQVAGGFQVGLTYEWQPGTLLEFGNLFYYGDVQNVANGPRTLERWFNTDGFERSASKAPTSFHRRVFPTRLDGLRGDMTNQWNGNLQREFRIREGMALQFRADVLNLQNRSQFDDPDTNPLSTNFGRVTLQTNGTMRFLQLQGRLRF